MNFFESFASILQAEWAKPVLFGWQHFLFLGLMVIAIILVCLFCKKLTDKQFRIIMLVLSLSLIILEICKQISFAYRGNGNWKYEWKQFPFQFCSVPMYVMLLVACLKECKFRDHLCSFLATFGLLLGLLL